MRMIDEKRATCQSSTLKDVARLAGVSTATVSRALNDPASMAHETRIRVLSAVSGLSYRPNPNAIELARQNGGIQRRRGNSNCVSATTMVACGSSLHADVGNKYQMMKRLLSLEDENAQLKRLVTHLNLGRGSLENR